MSLNVSESAPAEPAADEPVCCGESPDGAAGEACAEPSSCPPPLGWKSVLNVVRDESRAWEIDGKCGRIGGRTLGEGPPLYLLNGTGGTWELFALSMYLLREDFRCVIVEYPGENAKFSLDDFVADLFQIADEQGDATFSLFATSYGSAVAFAAMAAQPERIERAVIQAGVARKRLSVAERLLVGAGKLLPFSLARMPFFSRVQEHNHRTWFPPFDKSRWQFMVDNLGSVGVRTMCRRITAFQQRDLTGAISGITSPVHLLGSEGEGTAITQQRERLQQLLPHATTELLPHCGLLPFLTHPHLLSKALKSYFARDAEVES